MVQTPKLSVDKIFDRWRFLKFKKTFFCTLYEYNVMPGFPKLYYDISSNLIIYKLRVYVNKKTSIYTNIHYRSV